MLNSEQRETENDLSSLEPTAPSETLRRRISSDFPNGNSRKVQFVGPIAWFSTGSLVAASLTVLIYGGFSPEESPELEVKALEQAVLSAPLKADESLHRTSDSSDHRDSDNGPSRLDESSVQQSAVDSLIHNGESQDRIISVTTLDAAGSVQIVLKEGSRWISIKDKLDQTVFEGVFEYGSEPTRLPDGFEESLELIRSFEENIAAEYLK